MKNKLNFKLLAFILINLDLLLRLADFLKLKYKIMIFKNLTWVDDHESQGIFASNNIIIWIYLVF